MQDKKINNRLIFDGYPRNINQASKLDILTKNLGLKISCVLSLNVDKETIVKRILGRQTCSICGLIFNKYFNPATSKNHSCGDNFLQKRTRTSIAATFDSLDSNLALKRHPRRLSASKFINN